MLRSVLTICFGVTLLWGAALQGWSEDDIEDRFINPDIVTAKNIFIDVKDVSLIDVLKIISKQSGLSFIASQDVADKKITLYLDKVPLNQALKEILDAYDLTYQMQEDNNVFVVKQKTVTAKTKITKVYQLKYATVSSSKLFSTMSGGLSGSSSGSSSSSGGGTTSSGSGSGSVGGSSSSAGGLEDALKDALSPDGKIIEDTRTNSLIITDVPSQFDIIESTITKLDVPIPQILIEVEMIDVSKSTGDQLGISYGASPLNFTGGTKFTNFPFGPTVASTGSSSSSSSSSSSGSSSGSGSTVTTGWNANGMTAALEFIATQNDTRTLARPRILTLNNETAQIEISTDKAISVQSVASSTTTGSSTNTVTPERYTTGVILKVTPQANLITREITMAVAPQVIDAVPSDVTTPTNPIFDPETRGSLSMLRLKDGQSMVIGGLMDNVSQDSITKLPFLGDLPLIGGAFRSKSKSKSERELLIFLTPHIIDDADHSALKADSSSSVQEALDMQKAADRAQEINNNLNNLDTK